MAPETPHYNQTPRRKAEFFTPPNVLKTRVGTGGLNEEILNKAQALLEQNSVDFRPLGEMYLQAMQRGIDQARDNPSEADHENIIIAMLYPAMQLKANGGMFHYQLVTNIADKLIQFLEVVQKPDAEVIEIVIAFQTTFRAILMGQIKGDGGLRGAELMQALVDACYRYFEKRPDNRDNRPYNTNETF
jgi:hypothetical protein